MNLKIIFGIILPVIFIIFLAVIGSIDIGFSEKKELKSVLELEDFYISNQGMRQKISLGSIQLTNDYFLPKRHELKYYRACLIDFQNELEPLQAGNIVFSEGEYLPSNEVLGEYYGQTDSVRSVEVPSNGKKNIVIYLNPAYYFNYKNSTELMAAFGGYNSLILLEQKDERDYYDYYSSNNCDSLTEEEIEQAEQILINFT